MVEYLHFSFNLNDPEKFTYTAVIKEEPYLAHAFLKVPIYDNFHVQIGYKVSDDYIQQLSDDEYSVRINSTYHFFNNSSISWQFCFINDKPNYLYPLNVPNASNIVSTTGDYFGKEGIVSLFAKEDGSREVTILLT